MEKEIFFLNRKRVGDEGVRHLVKRFVLFFFFYFFVFLVCVFLGVVRGNVGSDNIVNGPMNFLKIVIIFFGPQFYKKCSFFNRNNIFPYFYLQCPYLSIYVLLC